MKIVKNKTMHLSDVNLREKKFHDELQSRSSYRKENIFYKSISSMFDDFNTYLESNANGKEILDIGCGIGSITEKIKSFNPFKIIGIDISDVSIQKAKESAKINNLDIEYHVDNCEKTSLKSDSFDIIYGSGILHHLNLEICLPEINRMLKQDGKMIFMEPMGTNPFINLYRKLTPKSRSRDEHPFVKKDFQLMRKIYSNVEIKYYGFLTLLFFPLYRDPKKSNFFKILRAADKKLLKIPLLQRFAWSVLIICTRS